MEKYKVIKILGEGAFGRVVEATDTSEQTEAAGHVAIKQIKKVWIPCPFITSAKKGPVCLRMG